MNKAVNNWVKSSEYDIKMVKKRSQIEKTIRLFVINLKRKGIKVNRVILYGSYAKGNHRPGSDIDVAVISSTFNSKNLLERQELLGEAIFGISEPVEAIGYSYNEFRKPRVLSFLFDIISNGKVIYPE